MELEGSDENHEDEPYLEDEKICFATKIVDFISRTEWDADSVNEGLITAQKTCKLILNIYKSFIDELMNKVKVGRHAGTLGFDSWLLQYAESKFSDQADSNAFLQQLIISVFHLSYKSEFIQVFGLLAGFPMKDQTRTEAGTALASLPSSNDILSFCKKDQIFCPYLFEDYYAPFFEELLTSCNVDDFKHLFPNGRPCALIDKKHFVEGVSRCIRAQKNPFEFAPCIEMQKRVLSFKATMCEECQLLKKVCKNEEHRTSFKNPKVVPLDHGLKLAYPVFYADHLWREGQIYIRIIKKLQRFARRFTPSIYSKMDSQRKGSRTQAKLEEAIKLADEFSTPGGVDESELYPGREDDGFGDQPGLDGTEDNQIQEERYVLSDTPGLGEEKTSSGGGDDFESGFMQTDSRLPHRPHQPGSVWRVTGENGAKVRQTPDINSPEVGQLKSGDLVEVGDPQQEFKNHPLVLKGRRVHIIHPVDGYVSKENADGTIRILTKETGFGFCETRSQLPGSYGSTVWRVTGENGSKVRETPDINSREVGQLQQGELVQVAFTPAEWSQHPLVQSGRRVYITKPVKGFVSKQNKDGTIQILTQEFLAGLNPGFDTFSQQTVPSASHYNPAHDAIQMMEKMDRMLELQYLLHKEFLNLKADVKHSES